MTLPLIAPAPASTAPRTPPAAVPAPLAVGRIAHFTDTYLPRRDGVVASLHSLRDAMTSLAGTSLIVAPRHRAQQHDAGMLTLRSFPCGMADLRLGGWPLAGQVERIRQWQPDLIHVHTPGPVGLLGVLAAHRLGVPLVHTYHTDLHAYADAYRMPGAVIRAALGLYALRLGLPAPALRPGVSRRHATLDAVNRLLLGDARAVVVPTPAVLTRIDLPVPAERVFLVPTGVRQRSVTAAEVARFRGEYGIEARDRVALFVGRVNREKGIELLLPAFARTLAEVPRAKLVLIGAVYEPRWLRRLLHRYGLGERVVVTGQLPPERVAAGYAGADVFAFPSRTDTQGLVLQEAALAGVPSLIADPQLHATGALGTTALLADATPTEYGAALARLLLDRLAARRAGALARERALEHTPERYAATMAKVYRFAGGVAD